MFSECCKSHFRDSNFKIFPCLWHEPPPPIFRKVSATDLSLLKYLSSITVIHYLLFIKGDEGATSSCIEKYLKENFPEKIEAVTDLTMAIRHAIQRGINSGRFVKEGRYVKLSDKYQARDAEKAATKEPKPSVQREIFKERGKVFYLMFLQFRTIIY